MTQLYDTNEFGSRLVHRDGPYEVWDVRESDDAVTDGPLLHHFEVYVDGRDLWPAGDGLTHTTRRLQWALDLIDLHRTDRPVVVKHPQEHPHHV